MINTIANYICEDKLEEALNLILSNEDKLNNNPEFWNLKGMLCLKVNEYKTATECLKKAISLDSTNSNYYYNLAYSLEQVGLYSESAVYYGLSQKYTNDIDLANELDNVYNQDETLSYIKKSAVENEKKTFVILSSCAFGKILQRMHHISRSLAKFGNYVHYISPEIEATVNSKEFDDSDAINYIKGNKRIIDNVEIYEPIYIKENGRVIYNSYIPLIQNIINESQNEVVIVAYVPHQVEVIKELKGNFKVIYECVDDHSDLEYAFWGHKQDILWEQELMDMSDAITTTATSLFLQRVAIEKRSNVYLSRNAVNEEDFILEDREIPDDLRGIPEPRIVYSGAIFNWFDKELFYDVVKSNPDKSFVVIGFGNEDILNEKCDNLFLLGAKGHSELKRYLYNCQASIIPFKADTDIIVNCDPIKQYEYIACGLPVISTYMPESIMNKVNSFIAKDKDEFNVMLETALKMDINKNIINKFLIENSWNQRAAILYNISNNNKVQKTNRDLDIVGNKLIEICSKYQFPVAETLMGMYLNIQNSKEFEEVLKNAYEKNKQKYIEKQYLRSLALNNEYEKFIDIVSKSKYIKSEIKEELGALKINSDEMKVIMAITLGEIKNAINITEKLKNLNSKKVYESYIDYILSENININYILRNISSNKPIGSFLCKTARDKKKSITILIPTRNRPDHLKRCINHFESMSCEELQVTVFVLDASDKKNSFLNKKFVNNKTNVRYFSCDENSNHFSRILNVYEKINTKYCCMCADDDFLNKDGIIKSIEVLSSDDSIVTVKGKTHIFFDDNLIDIYNFPRDSCKELTEDAPNERLNKFLDNWVPQLYYLVYRKNDLIDIIKNFIENQENKINDWVFEEYLLYFLVPLYGKIVNINEVLNIRNESSKSDGYTLPGFQKHTIDRKLNIHYKNFREKIINFCKSKDICLQYEEMDLMFSKFLTNSWGVREEYIKINGINDADKEFDLELLERGFKRTV